jgi:hypothetical protein
MDEEEEEEKILKFLSKKNLVVKEYYVYSCQNTPLISKSDRNFDVYINNSPTIERIIKYPREFSYNFLSSDVLFVDDIAISIMDIDKKNKYKNYMLKILYDNVNQVLNTKEKYIRISKTNPNIKGNTKLKHENIIKELQINIDELKEKINHLKNGKDFIIEYN